MGLWWCSHLYYFLKLFNAEEEKDAVSDEDRKETSPEVLEAQFVGKWVTKVHTQMHDSFHLPSKCVVYKNM